VYPDRQDRHDDHWATQAFVQHALVRHPLHVREWAFPVHFAGWPRPHSFQPERVLDVPPEIRNQDHWRSLPLTDAELTIKYQALHAHQSQIRVMRGFLESFIRRNELFQEISR
jgi:LmbE family N-acetylglucosaminyl deacetylase